MPIVNRKSSIVNQQYAAGIDVGSTQTKAVLIDASRAIVARALINNPAFLFNR